MKKYDFYIIIFMVITSAGFFFMNIPKSGSKMSAEIYVEGKLYKNVPLKNEEQKIEIETESGHNTLMVYSDGIKMIYADCPTGTCVHTAKQSLKNSVIACMPHKILVKLTGNDNSEVDIIAD